MPRTPAVAASPDEVAFWLYSSGSTGAPKGVRHVHASLRHTADTYGAQVLGIRRDDLMFSAAKAFHAYGLGNSLTFPMSVGAAAVLLPDRPTPDAVLEMMQRHNPTIFGGVPTLYASLLAHPRIGPKARVGAPAPLHLGRRGAAGGGRQRWFDMVGVRHPGRHRLDRDAAYLRHQPAGRRALRHRPASRCPATRRTSWTSTAARCRMARPANWWCAATVAADGYWNQRDKTRRTFRGEWTHTGDTYTRDAEGYFRYCGRSDEMLKVSGVWVSPFEVEEALVSHPAVLEAAVVGRDGPRRPDQAEGVRHFAGSGEAAGRGHGEGAAEDACERADRRVEIPALDRVRGRPAEDRDRQDPALPAARRKPLRCGRGRSSVSGG